MTPTPKLTPAQTQVRPSEEWPPVPEGDRFNDVTKFRCIGSGQGKKLYECWEDAILAYARLIAEECAKVCEQEEFDGGYGAHLCATAIRAKFGVAS